MDARDALWESATGLSIPQIHLFNPEAERQDGAQESKTTGCEDRSAIGFFFWCLPGAFGHVCAWLSSKALQEVLAVNAGQGRCSVASMLAEGRLAQNSADQHLRGKHVEAETWAV